jgi:hypothetical protein
MNVLNSKKHYDCHIFKAVQQESVINLAIALHAMEALGEKRYSAYYY